MRTEAQIRKALGRILNVSAFARRHALPLRTVMRVKAGTASPAKAETLAMLDAALNAEAKR